VTGPGVVYRLRFQAGEQDALTTISLLEGTAFYNAGAYVTPVYLQDASIQVGTTSDVAPFLPVNILELHSAPNPFNPRTVISFDAPEPARARLTVYSAEGKAIRRLLDEQIAAGVRTVIWDGRDETGRASASGVYLLRLDLAGLRAAKTVTLLR
jgi:hypothetical protein